MIHITIPKPPPLSALYTNVPGRGRVKTARYRTWKRAVEWEFVGCKPISGQVDIRISLEPPRNKDGSIPKTKHDCSNLIKAVEDLLVDLRLIEDDSYPTVRSTAAEWVEGLKDCVVAVFPVAGAHAATPSKFQHAAE